MQFLDVSSAPLGLILPPLFLALLIGAYALISPHFHAEKQKAYVLSTCSSLTMSLLSLPYLGHYLTSGLEPMYELAQEGWRKEIGRVGVIFFGTYLFADLAVGYIKYPSQIGLLTGWIHHIVYIALMLVIYQTRLAPVFLVSAIMELPTFDLAISNLFPSLRSDLRFLSSFFAVRIAFHIFWLLDCLRPASRAVTDGSWLPTSMLTAALVLHVSWFRGGLNGYIKRRRAARKNPAPAEKTSSSTATVDPSTPALIPTTDHLTPPSSPDDSPLHTPYTPGTIPMTLRDSYLYTTVTAVSNLSIPSIPSLSDFTHAFPPLPLPMTMGGREFKDAVKHRWQEGKDKFGNVHMGMGMGMGMNLGMGMGPILRRRAGRQEGERRDAAVQSGRDA